MTPSRPPHRLAAVTVALLGMWALVHAPAAGAGFWGFAGGPKAAHDLSTAALEPASDLTATTSCDPAVPLTANATLSWTETPSTFAEGYTVERWRGSELEATTTVTPRTTTTLTEAALSAGTLYT